jgi:hypothetical protein
MQAFVFARIVLVCLLALGVLAAPAYADHRDPERWEEPVEEPSPAPAPVVEEPEEEWPEDEWEGEDEDDDWERARPEPPPIKIVKGRAVVGRVAALRADGKAAVPLGAPVRIRRLISAINEIVGKPYKWGGGHGSLFDRGYDCSGAVGYGLRRTGLLGTPLTSGGFARWARPGKGRWLTIYANRGHVYLEIAGLRLDTSEVGDYSARRRKGVRWRPVIGQRRGFRARHVAGL